MLSQYSSNEPAYNRLLCSTSLVATQPSACWPTAHVDKPTPGGKEKSKPAEVIVEKGSIERAGGFWG